MKTIALTTISLLMATSAMAEQIKANVEDVYSKTYESVPYTDNDCVNVQVPVYGERQVQGDAAGSALLGMIIGGAIGKGVSGNNDGAAAGAVMGGIIGADQGSRVRTEKVITGYRSERQCTEITRYKEVERTVYSHSVLTFKVNGITYETTFVK